MTEHGELFTATTELHTIYQWARARYAAPLAVCGAVLLRVAASTGPHVQLPGLIGGPASLNLMAGFVSASGGGKGISDRVARDAWPAPIVERPIGSGEGIAAAFMPPKKEGQEPVTRAIFHVPEVDTLAGIASRQGAIVLPQLKSMAMGELLGQSNASEATTRIIPAHSYRACLSVGAQPGHTGVIFNDTTGGTPQRFLWFPTTAPTMPAEATAEPAPLNTALPAWAQSSSEPVEMVYGPEEIRETVIAAHLARQRGEADALDGHALLTRCKVAAVIAILHHRSVVSELDWQLSAVVMDVSDHTRNWLLDEAKRAERAKTRARALGRVEFEEVIDQRRAETVRRRILRILEQGPTSHGVVHSRIGKKEYKELFPSVLATLLESGQINQEETTRGKRYSLSEGVKVDPGVKVDNRRSDALTPGVKDDPKATVTHLDPRRSESLHLVPPSAAKWFAHHLATLQKEGHSTANSFAVYEAGRAAGYKTPNLRHAARSHPDVQAVENLGPNGVLWDITPKTANYQDNPANEETA